MRARKVDPDELRRLYLDESLRVVDIARHFGCSIAAVSMNITLLDLPKRSVHCIAPVATESQSRLARVMLTNGFDVEEVSVATGLTLASARAIAAQVAGETEALPTKADKMAKPRQAHPDPNPEDVAHPFWTPERDLLVFNTKGVGQEISELATLWGRPITFVMQRWHRLRVTG